MSKDKPLTKRDIATLAKYFETFNATLSWMFTHPDSSYDAASVSASKWLRNPKIKAAIDQRLADMHMSADEAMKRTTDIGRGDMGVFYKVVDEWMFNPLPFHEILDEVEVIDDTNKDKPVKRISYRVRYVVLDMDKVVDPQYSYLIKSFSNTRRNGVKIELYSADAAHDRILRIHGKFKDPGTKENPLHIDGLESYLDKIYGRNNKG